MKGYEMSKQKASSMKSSTKEYRRRRKTKPKPPRTAVQYAAKPEKFKEMWDRIVTVVSRMRAEKTSLEQASRDARVSPKTVKRWAQSALKKDAGGTWAAKRSDNLLRVLMIPGPDGAREIAVRGSRYASQLAKYWSALHWYLQTGDASRLLNFRGQSIKNADGVQIPLPTDRAILNRLGSAGVLSFESLYARTA